MRIFEVSYFFVSDLRAILQGRNLGVYYSLRVNSM